MPPLPPHVPCASNQGRNAQAKKVSTSMSDKLTNTPRPWPPPTAAGLTLWLAPEKPNPLAAATSSNETDKPQGFLMVKHCRNRGGTAKKEGLGAAPKPTHINLTPTSYANAAAVAADLPQKCNAGKSAPSPPSITKVTVLRYGGHMDADTKQQIYARAPNAIICEVKLRMVKALSNPISLRVGRWSIHPHSKGNFIYSFTDIYHSTSLPHMNISSLSLSMALVNSAPP